MYIDATASAYMRPMSVGTAKEQMESQSPSAPVSNAPSAAAPTGAAVPSAIATMSLNQASDGDADQHGGGNDHDADDANTAPTPAQPRVNDAGVYNFGGATV
jgi:hypothetical protein